MSVRQSRCRYVNPMSVRQCRYVNRTVGTSIAHLARTVSSQRIELETSSKEKTIASTLVYTCSDFHGSISKSKSARRPGVVC